MLFILNFFILQWFFIRLGTVVNVTTNRTCGLFFLYNIVPLTGWWNGYSKGYKRTKTWMFRK